MDKEYLLITILLIAFQHMWTHADHGQFDYSSNWTGKEQQRSDWWFQFICVSVYPEKRQKQQQQKTETDTTADCTPSDSLSLAQLPLFWWILEKQQFACFWTLMLKVRWWLLWLKTGSCIFMACSPNADLRNLHIHRCSLAFLNPFKSYNKSNGGYS